jgi:formate-dependent nitrite reductase membrane component NrfD
MWHWEIPVYLFLGGLAAGLIFFSALYTIAAKEKEYKTAVKSASILAPFIIILGLVALFLDLKHKLFFWQLYTTIKLESPMSWGAWTLMAITPLSLVWTATFLKDLFPVVKFDKSLYVWILKLAIKQTDGEQNWEWNYKMLVVLESWIVKNRILYAWVLIFYSVILGVYTGILLSAFNARPLWNTSILGPLFLVSGLSTAAATIMWMSKDHAERKMFSKIDLILIIIELFLIAHLFMGFRAGPEVQVEAAKLFLGGEYTVQFWIFVVAIGMVLPAILEIIELAGKRIPVFIPAILILFGGVFFRFIMVDAGQIIRYLY